MYTIMPSYSYFVVKRLIGSLVFMVTFAVIMLVFKNYRFSWVIPIFLIVIYLCILFVYFPLKFKNTRYQIKDTSLTITSGIIFRYEAHIFYGSINYIEKRQNILQKLCGTYTLVLYGMGNKNHLKDISIYGIKIMEIKIGGE